MNKDLWFNSLAHTFPELVNMKGIDKNDIFESLFNPDSLSFVNGCRGLKTDIKETDTSYVLDVEIPGYNKEDINLEVNDGVLTLTAKTNKETEDKTDNYIRKERVSGKMSRSFTFEKDIAEDAIRAKYNNGILTVEVPKLQKVSSKKGINIE